MERCAPIPTNVCGGAGAYPYIAFDTCMQKTSDEDVIEAVGGLPDTTHLAQVLDSGGNPNAMHLGRSALDWAVSYRYLDKVRLLLSHGANPNVLEQTRSDSEGHAITPLIGAVRHDSNRELVELLLDSGADPNLADGTEMTPLMCAASAGATEVAKLLVTRGADVHRTTDDGQDALYFAMTRDRPELVRFLLGCGLDPKASPTGRSSAMDRAQRQKLTGALTVLEERGYK
jgi:hypothetical protein